MKYLTKKDSRQTQNLRALKLWQKLNFVVTNELVEKLHDVKKYINFRKKAVNMLIELEPLEERHFSWLLKWLETPHVKKWWDQDVIYNMESVKAKYHSYVKSYKLVEGVEKPIRGFIIYVEKNPIGYIQIYNIHDFSRDESLANLPRNLGTFDIFIGEKSFLQRNIGSKVINELLRLHAGEYSQIFVSTDAKNVAAIKSYKKVGFKKIYIGKTTKEIGMLKNLSLSKKSLIIKKIIKVLKYSILAFLLSCVVFFVLSLAGLRSDRENNLVTQYLEMKFSNPANAGILEIFEKIPDAENGEKIIILGSEIDQKILLFPLKKKYQVIALDTKLIWYETMTPNYEKYRDQFKILDNWQIADLPKVKIIMANYALSFQDRAKFRETWANLDQKLEVGGYFIGGFLGEGTNIFPSEYEENINFLSKDQLEELLENYRIIWFKESKNYLATMKGEEVYYQVFAIKIR